MHPPVQIKRVITAVYLLLNSARLKDAPRAALARCVPPHLRLPPAAVLLRQRCADKHTARRGCCTAHAFHLLLPPRAGHPLPGLGGTACSATPFPVLLPCLSEPSHMIAPHTRRVDWEGGINSCQGLLGRKVSAQLKR